MVQWISVRTLDCSASLQDLTLRTVLIPGAEFIVLPEASHSINWEQPEAFNHHVLEFIRRH